MAGPRIFISMGTPYTEEYAQFRDDLETFLRNTCGADPRIIGRNEYPSGNPLAHIRDVMRTCHGVIIVAYERKYLDAGIEKRGGDAQQKISKRIYTTPWNHIESAIAYTLSLPLYILCQKGLSEEGLIESKLDWYVQHLDISREGLHKPEVTESLRSWVASRTVPQSKKKLRPLQVLQGGLKLSEMTPKEYLAVGGVLSTTFALGVAAARIFPKLFG